jgi:virulence-associated protein VapD
MVAVLERLLGEARQESGLHLMPLGVNRLYAIAFDLDQETLRETYGNASFQNAYSDIRRRLESEGFTWMQGSLYYGREGTDPVRCVLVIQRLARELPWFANSVRDIRMLRIEENNDLKPAIPQPELPLG